MTESALLEAYASSAPGKFGLFIGAGVNLPVERNIEQRFPALSWEGLLRSIHEASPNSETETFEAIRARCNGAWVPIAGEILGQHSEEDVAQLIDDLLYAGHTRGDKYRRLSRHFLQQAPVLHAAIAFTATVKAFSERGPTFKRNPRVGRVLTTNYDFFFGAGWTRYETFKAHWQIRTQLTPADTQPSSKGCLDYLHGYLPYAAKNREGRSPGLVLKPTAYERYYADEGRSRLMLREALETTRMLMLGLSLDDAYLLDELAAQDSSHRGRHFIVTHKESQSTIRAANAVGVQPVVVESYADIPPLLELIYARGLARDGQSASGVVNAQQHWRHLMDGKSR